MRPSRPIAVLTNRQRLDFERSLDFSGLRGSVELRVHDDLPPDGLVAAAEGATILITKELPVGTDTLHALPPTVRLICEAGTGYDNVAHDAARERGIDVCNVPGYSTSAVAQLVLGYVLGVASGTLGYTRRLARGDRGDFERPASPFEVAGKVMGVIGAGAIGREVARLSSAFGMEVLVYGRRPVEWAVGGIRQASLDHIFATGDFVSLHLPLQRGGPDATLHMVDAVRLATMQPTAWLINTARGPLVDEAALVRALTLGQLAGVALDVQETEPPPAESALWTHPSVYLSPHVGWKAVEARQRLLDGVGANIAAWLRGAPTNVVN